MRAVIGAEPCKSWEGPQRIDKKCGGGHALSGRRCSHPLPPERIAHVDGAQTPGFETGNVGREGQESDLIVTSAIPWGQEEG